VLDSETNIHPEIDQVCNCLDHNHSPVMDSNIVSMTREMASAINGVFIHIHPSNFSYDKLPKVLRKTNESTTGTRGDLESYHTATIFSSLGASGSKRLPTPPSSVSLVPY